jgi:hypothetical protein
MTGLPHAKSSSFSLTYALFFSCSPADERSCGLGEKTGATSWEHVNLKRRKEDFREAMRWKGIYHSLLSYTSRQFTPRMAMSHSVNENLLNR